MIVSLGIATFSFMTAYELFSSNHKNYLGSAQFTGTVFLAHACYLMVVIFYTMFSGPIRSYTDYGVIQIAAFVVPTITSTLWTFGFILMVNQRLSAENQAEKESLQLVFNASPDAAAIARLNDGLFVDVNQGFLDLSGYDRSDIVGHSIFEIDPWSRSEDRTNFVNIIKENGVCENIEYVFHQKDGSPFVGMLSAKTINLHGLPHVLGVVRDISERKRVEAQNRQIQKVESLGRMAGAIAHLFNNKLQTVMGSLELMGGLPRAVDPTKYLTMAMQATEGAAALSRQMLVYLGQTSGTREPRFLGDLCREGLGLIRSNLPEQVELETEIPFPGPVIHANSDQMHQVLTNLMVNAWEAMAEGKGRIRLSLQTCPAADIPALHRFPVDWQPQEGDHACLEIADTGSGIAAADIEKLFDPFFSTKFTGRGLGLPVVLGIVQAHGGAIVADSALGQGSVFRVYFPIAAGALASPPEGAIRRADPASGGTILLIDDDECLLQSTGAMLDLLGFTLLTAKDGAEALEVFRQHRQDIRCVITDLTMPRMNGWETLTALRQLEPALPVVLASGYDKAQVMSGAPSERPQAFLGKPFGLQQLREALNQALAT